jgi:hypothetical protein
MSREYTIPTASTVALFIDGIHIDLLHRLDYKESFPKLPRYGYNDTIYTNTMPGRKIIQGFLAIVFVEPAYLTRVLENNRINKIDNVVASSAQSSLDSLPGYTTEEEKQGRAQYIADLLFPSGKYPKHFAIENDHDFAESVKINKTALEKDLFVKKLIDKFSTGEIPTSKQGPEENVLTPLDKGPVDMDIYYLDPSRATWYIRLNNVSFDQIEQTIAGAGAEGSSEPLYEVYSFQAANKTIKIRIQ